MQSPRNSPNSKPANIRLSTGSAVQTDFKPSEAEILTAVGEWLLTALPAGFGVFQGQQNQFANPLTQFATMTIVARERKNTDSVFYVATERIIQKSVLLTIQIDVWGAGAGNAAERVETLWRSPSSCDFFREIRPECAPTHANDPHQQGFQTAEKQYEDHWIVDLKLNAITQLSSSQESALSAQVSLINADFPSKIIPPTKRKMK
ncbi:hypothetical protein FAI40_10065 [Acetobacteraceae bacterium]|nr:hypothetical protein FAI40_10065 [Acetobacteraceae bacterium]